MLFSNACKITLIDSLFIYKQIIRLESQVKRYKAAAENAEKMEEDLKQEKRKLQREVSY